MLSFKRLAAVLTVLFLFLMLYSTVGTLEYKQEQMTASWAESIRAYEMQQEETAQMILQAQEDLKRYEKQLEAHNLLIWDIRERVHLDLEWEIENDLED